MTSVVAGAAVQSLRPEDTGAHVRGGTADCFDAIVLPEFLPAVRQAAPGVAVWSRSVPNEDLERALQSRDIDLGFGTRFEPVAGLVCDTVGEERLLVLLRADHPSVRHGLSLRAYAGLEHLTIAPRGQQRSAIDGILAPLGATRRVVARMPSFSAAAAVAACTDYCVTLPASFARSLEKLMPVRVFELPFPSPRFTLALAYSRAVAGDPAHRWFRERVADACRAALVELRPATPAAPPTVRSRKAHPPFGTAHERVEGLAPLAAVDYLQSVSGRADERDGMKKSRWLAVAMVLACLGCPSEFGIHGRIENAVKRDQMQEDCPPHTHKEFSSPSCTDPSCPSDCVAD